MAERPDYPGHTSVTPRALSRLAQGVAAEHLGVTGSRVAVQLSDAAGLLSVAVAAPLRFAPLDAEDAGGLITRSKRAQARIARDITEISGSRVDTVALRITGIERTTPRRVA